MPIDWNKRLQEIIDKKSECHILDPLPTDLRDVDDFTNVSLACMFGLLLFEDDTPSIEQWVYEYNRHEFEDSESDTKHPKGTSCTVSDPRHVYSHLDPDADGNIVELHTTRQCGFCDTEIRQHFKIPHSAVRDFHRALNVACEKAQAQGFDMISDFKRRSGGYD